MKTLKDLIPVTRKNKNDSQAAVATRQAGDPFVRLHREIDDLFDSLVPGFFRGAGLVDALWHGDFDFAPSLELEETSKEIRVAAELPGVDEQDIQVSLENDVLTISGEKKQEKDVDQDGWQRSERVYGSFRRSVALPAEVALDKVAAKFKNGVLRITLPKVEAASPKAHKIAVQTD